MGSGRLNSAQFVWMVKKASNVCVCFLFSFCHPLLLDILGKFGIDVEASLNISRKVEHNDDTDDNHDDQ